MSHQILNTTVHVFSFVSKSHYFSNRGMPRDKICPTRRSVTTKSGNFTTACKKDKPSQPSVFMAAVGTRTEQARK